MAIISAAGLATTLNRRTTPVGSDLQQMKVQYNNLLTQYANIWAGFLGCSVLKPTALGIGTTVTLATGACQITINGVPVLVAAQTAQAFGALGTIPASVWGLIAVEAVAAGTITFVSAAANYTTGYATEALAIAAIPSISANKCRIGYLTVLASASTWVAGTDALATGTGGNPATTTNYYNTVSIADLTLNPAALVLGDAGGTPTYP